MPALSTVVCKKDFDKLTHKMVSGKEYTIPWDHAETLEREGIVDVKERPAFVAGTSDLEKRLAALEEKQKPSTKK